MNASVLCFRKFPVAKKFDRGDGGGVGESQDFLREVFCLTVLKISVGWKSSVRHSSPVAKIFDKSRRRRGKNQDVTSETFVSHC